ncbi:MAG: hypothetical protein LLG02_04745 [Pelosinus sp.]|nr:hypothetical protein [Pelosinus sp.]
MFYQLLFHLLILVIIALFTVVPSMYLISYRAKHPENHSQNDLWLINRRQAFWPWVLLSSLYMGRVIADEPFPFWERLLAGMLWYLFFASILLFPLAVNKYFAKRYTGWIRSMGAWLNYPK